MPKAEFINEDNRFSPVGVEWLYLAWASDKNLAEQCTIKECRASTGNRFGICLFEINSANKDEKIIDLTLADEMTYEDINTQLENSGKVYLSRRYERRMKKGRVVIPTENEINEMKPQFEDLDSSLDDSAADYIAEAMMMVVQDAGYLDLEMEELVMNREW